MNRRSLGAALVALAAFVRARGAVIGAGQETVYLRFVWLLAGLPLYVWLRR